MKPSIKYIFLVLVAFQTPSLAQETALYQVVTAISSESPESSLEDLNFLNETFQNKTIISIGEGTHGTREFALMRHKIFQFLVAQHGFNTIFMEDEYSRCLLVDDYIKGKSDKTSKEVTQNFRNWPWKTQEMQELIEWMREYNQAHPDNLLSFVGADSQDGEHMLQEVNTLLQTYQPNIAIQMPAIVMDKVHEKWSKTEVEVFDQEVLVKLTQLMEPISFQARDLEVLLNLKRGLEQYKMDHEAFGNGYTAYRDFCMGENIIHAMQKDPKIKGLYIAHTAHIAKVYKRKKSIKSSYGYAGGVLATHFGDQHFSLAMDFDEGSFNAYYTKNKEAASMEDFELMEITIEESIKHSIAAEFRNTDCSICYIPMDQVEKIRTSKDYSGYKKYFYNHLIGARFYPTKNNERQTMEYMQFADENYDAFIIFKQSTASSLIR